MPNERITENIVRGLLRSNGYYSDDNILIEEQQSHNPRIDKLLRNASKGGSGKGYPEFIISFKNDAENLIVIECKAKTSQHESENRKQYKNFAVDGVLLYASYLKNDFNVTAIAVSGQNDRDKKISSFLWLKKNFFYKNIQNKILPKPIEVKKIINQQSRSLDEQELIKKANEYNEFLYKYSIPETERCSLISAILIALQDDAFLISFQSQSPNKALIKAMLSACENVLKKNLPDEKVKVMLKTYSQFEHNKDFNSENTILKDFIKQIVDEILPYVKESEFDVLGKFYTQFIRYAGSDKTTGLVLTPSHVTDLFCDIAALNVDDIVFDPCCGTAGFLVSAMNYMLKKAGHDEEKQKKIKSDQLIGIEKRPDMFSHACSNMMMRGDGKSNIIYGDCFEENNKNSIKKFNPTKTFLNPPYGKTFPPHKQLKFVRNALECLTKDGICVAICQMSTVVSSNKEVEEEKVIRKAHAGSSIFHAYGFVPSSGSDNLHFSI